MIKWQYCEFRYKPAKLLSKKEAAIIYFTKNGSVVENLGQDADEAKVISRLGEEGFEMVNCIHDTTQAGYIEAVAYIFKRPIP